MQPTMCSRCHKHVAVVFITKLEGGQSKNEGLCLKCAKELGIKPIAKLIEFQVAGCDATEMGMGPRYAIPKALEHAHMTIDQMDIIELNEAFASQSVACIRDLGLDPAKVNINGGAIALGHPLGCTGARLIVTLMHNLKRTGGKIGLATLCIGGGQAMAALIEMQ